MDKNKPFISRLSPAGQELLGIIIGIPSDFILQQFGFVALIKLHLIKLE